MVAVYSTPNDLAIKTQPAKPPKLLDRWRHDLRTKHYSYRTEQCYVAWIVRFLRFHRSRTVHELLGNTDVRTTMIYAHGMDPVSRRVRAARVALD